MLLTCPDHKCSFEDYMTTRAGELSFADQAAEFAKDELKVPDINSLHIEHAKQLLIDTLQEAKGNWKAGLDELGILFLLWLCMQEHLYRHQRCVASAVTCYSSSALEL